MATTISFADRMRNVTTQARGDFTSYKDFKDAADVKKFFETEVKAQAQDKIERRAISGHFTSNILEYGYYEYFYITHDGEVVRMPKFDRIPGAYLHRVHTIVHGDLFQRLLEEFVTTLGMRVSCWYPGKDLTNVVTVSWAPPRNANANATEAIEATDAADSTVAGTTEQREQREQRNKPIRTKRTPPKKTKRTQQQPVLEEQPAPEETKTLDEDEEALSPPEDAQA